MVRYNYFKTAWYHRFGSWVAEKVLNIIYGVLAIFGAFVGIITVFIGIVFAIFTATAPFLIPILIVAALLKFLFW